MQSMRVKSWAGKRLRVFDLIWQVSLLRGSGKDVETMRKDPQIVELLKHVKETDSEILPVEYLKWLPALANTNTVPLLLARLNLDRTALDFLIDPASAERAKRVNFGAQPDHPWRDPFNEQPLQVNSETSRTLIWSIGMDRVDQRGELIFDPASRHGSRLEREGDLVISVPAREKMK
jgi:hypothetical protein